jgi:tetratricopeptide (TPR) repeat protein
MSSVFKKYSTNIRIGELLCQSGLLTQAQMAEATRHSGAKRLQIGQILVMHGYLSARDLQSALDAQSAIRDKSVDLDLAIRCLKTSVKTGTSFADVLMQLAGPRTPRIPTGKLGQLLFDAGLVTIEQLSVAMQRSLTAGLPLGRMLVIENVLTDAVLTAALEIQVRLRDDMLTRGEAIVALRRAASLPPAAPDGSELTPKASFSAFPLRRHGIRLGEMMVLAGLMTDTDMMNALEWGLVKNQPIGEVLVKKALIKQGVIDSALALQRLVEENKLEGMIACECLGRIALSGISVEEALAEIEDISHRPTEPVLSYQSLLTLSRVVSDDDVETAFDINSMGPQIIGKILNLTGYVDDATLRATLQCHSMLSKGLMTQDDAVASLDYCLHQRPGKEIEYDQALKELGWTGKEPLKLSGDDKIKALGSKPDGQDGKFVQTISPEDRQAATLFKLMKENAGPATEAEAAANAVEGEALLNAFARLAQSYCEQGNYQQSQLVYERILVDQLNKLGPNAESLTGHLQSLAGVLCAQGKFNQSESFMRRTVSIMEAKPDRDPISYADSLSILAGIYYRQEKFNEAEPLALRAVKLREEFAADNIDELVDALNDHAKVLRKLGRNDEAESIYSKAQTLQADALQSMN